MGPTRNPRRPELDDATVPPDDPRNPRGPVSLERAAADLPDTWSPQVVARVDDHFVKVARVEGTFVWHDHADQDELFLVLRGRLRIQFEDRDEVVLDPGDVYVVPRGVRHNPVAEEECLLALVERVDTAHTGDVVTDRTRSVAHQLGRSADGNVDQSVEPSA